MKGSKLDRLVCVCSGIGEEIRRIGESQREKHKACVEGGERRYGVGQWLPVSMLQREVATGCRRVLRGERRADEQL